MSGNNHRLRLGTAAFALGLSLTGANAAIASADTGSANTGSTDTGSSDSGSANSDASAKPSAAYASPARGVARAKPKAGTAPKITDVAGARTPERGPEVIPPTAAATVREPAIARSSSPSPSLTTEVASAVTSVSAATGVSTPAVSQPRAAAAVVEPAVAPTTAKATAVSVPPDLLSNISDWVASWPASPVKSMLEGAVLMARRYFFNRDPITNPVQTVTLSNGQIFGTLGAFDPEGDAIEYVVTQGPKYGTVTIDSFGAYVYTPGAGYTGTDSFVVNVDDPGFHMNLGRLFATGDLATINVVRNAALPSGSLADNFSGQSGALPDSANWSVLPGHDGGIQVYTDSSSNIRLDGDGNLVIEALTTEDGFTSARIVSQDLLHAQYGTIVARIKMPAGQGIWPSFWMLGEDYADVGWPNSGEIDIMELVNTGTQYHVTLHGPHVWPSGEVTDYYGGGDASGKVVGVKGSIEDLSADYHDYWMKWREDHIEIGVDSQTLAVFTPDDLPDGAVWKFNQPMFFVMQVAVGGTWAGLPDETTQWPATMLIDSFQYTPYV